MNLSRQELDAIGMLMKAVEKLGLDVMLIGAGAKRLLLEGAEGRPAGRATMDWDWGVWIPDWETFDRLTKDLLLRGFTRDQGIPHRLERDGVRIDIVPYGPVAGDGKIVWRETGAEMSVLGFAEARESVRMEEQQGLELPVVSVPALVMLKLISHGDDPIRRRRDLEDVLHILGESSEFLTERMLEELADEFADGTVDFDEAGPVILGRDVAGLAREDTLRRLAAVLEKITGDPDPSLMPLLKPEWSDEEQQTNMESWSMRLAALLQGLRS